MRRTWRMLGLAIGLWAVLAIGPTQAGQIDGPESDKGDSVAKQLRDLKKSIDDFRKDMSLVTSAFQKVYTDMNDLHKQVADLRREVNSLKERPSFSPPNPG